MYRQSQGIVITDKLLGQSYHVSYQRIIEKLWADIISDKLFTFTSPSVGYAKLVRATLYIEMRLEIIKDQKFNSNKTSTNAFGPI